MRRVNRFPTRLVLALVMLIAWVGLDFVPPSLSWWQAHPHFSAAISTVISFIVAGILLSAWLDEREARRLSRVSTVAYRGLAQAANDAVRTLLAPLMGVDLFRLGLPDATPQDVVDVRRRLNHDHRVESPLPELGSWRHYDRDYLDETLRLLASDDSFLESLFRSIAVIRRRAQDVTGLWAPVMFTSRVHSSHLARFRDVTDSLELLQERLRAVIHGRIGSSRESLDLTVTFAQQFWQTVSDCEITRDTFADLAELPSDSITRRQLGVERPTIPS